MSLKTSISSSNKANASDWAYFVQTYQRTIPYYAIVGIDGTTVYAIKSDGSLIQDGTAGTDDSSVINAAISAANGHGSVLIRAGTYTLSSTITMSDMSVRLIGERNSGGSGANGVSGDTILKGTTAIPVITCVNSQLTKQEIEKLVIEGQDTATYGIKAYWVTDRVFLRDVDIYDCDKGLSLQKAWNSDIYGVRITSCTTYGIEVLRGVEQPVNTIRFFGGKATNNGINVYMDGSNDNSFIGTLLEGPVTSCVQLTDTANDTKFINCSFEGNVANGLSAGWIAIDDGGNNNTYTGCRFASDINFIPISLGANSRNCKFFHNFIQANAASLTATITIASGSQNNYFIGNTASTNTPITIAFSDSGSKTWRIGNSGVADRMPNGVSFGTNGLKLTEQSSTEVDLTDSGGNLSTCTLRLYGTAQTEIRTTGQTTCGYTNAGGYIEVLGFSRASDPTTSDVHSRGMIIAKNTNTGAVKLWYNDNGSMKSVTLT